MADMFNLLGEVVDNAVRGVKEVVTFIPSTAVEVLGEKSKIISTATDIFNGANNESRSRLVDEVLQRSPGLINPETFLEAGRSLCDMISKQVKERPANQIKRIEDIINCSLELVDSAVDLVTPDMLLRIVKKVTTAILRAFISTVGNLPFIKDAVFSNDINAATLGLIWSNWANLVRFIVDLVECTKRYVPNNSPDGEALFNESRVQANELDFSKTMNRHAAICQLQRLALSIVFILTGMINKVDIPNMNESQRIEITESTTLQSDREFPETIPFNLEELSREQAEKGNAPKISDAVQTEQTDETVGMQQPKKTKDEEEKWLFINGIAGEYHWTHLACEKLAKQYRRNITGIFNRGDGILWDLVECAGERSSQGRGNARSQKQLIKRTESSRNAQEILKKELENAIQEQYRYIVMIAHSQGCLLLRLALEELITTASLKDREMMKDRICIFTFGNPSIDWAIDDCVESKDPLPRHGCKCHAGEKAVCRHLMTYVLRTEHFANSEDFVAKLGVLSEPNPTESSYESGYDCVFINEEEDWKTGHLFGSQYSLNSDNYRANSCERSWLLACENGKPMRDARRDP